VSSAEEFSIHMTDVPGSLVLSVRGDLDAGTAPQLEDALQDLRDHDSGRHVIVDVEGLTFIDSSGVYVLVQALKKMRSSGQRLTVSGATPRGPQGSRCPWAHERVRHFLTARSQQAAGFGRGRVPTQGLHQLMGTIRHPKAA